MTRLRLRATVSDSMIESEIHDNVIFGRFCKPIILLNLF